MMSKHTKYNEFVHPNMEGEESDKATGCLACWDRFDDRWIRPYLIYKFDRLKERPEFEFEDML